MKIKKTLKISFASLLGLGVLLFIVLIIHIAIMVKENSPIVDKTIQMARVDYNQPIDSMNLVNIEKDIKGQNGVKSVYYNSKTHVIIYTFDNRKNNADNIYNTAIKRPSLNSKRYIVTAQDMTKGCPAFNNHSLFGHLTTLVAKVIN